MTSEALLDLQLSQLLDELDQITTKSSSQPEILPTVNFKTDVSYGLPWTGVQFSDCSQGQVRKWHWTFGDGSSSNHRNPRHIYFKPGSYRVSLTVNDDITLVRPNCVQITLPLVTSKFRYHIVPRRKRTFHRKKWLVTFYDRSTGQPSEWQWNFGNGLTSNLRNPSILLRKGPHQVSLRVRNEYSDFTDISHTRIHLE